MAETPVENKPQGTEEPKFDGNPTIGAVIGAVAGGALGCWYGMKFNGVTDLSMGPVPGPVVGLIGGVVFGAILGVFVGAAGKAMLTPKAALGFAIGAGILIMGRLADDTGQPIDKIKDIVVAGIFWGTIGSIVGAVGIGNGESGENSAPPSGDQQQKS